MKLSAELRSLIKKPCYARPFVSDGLPRSCDVVVIGENPATKMNINWWRFWNDKNGFNLAEFERTYEKARVADGKPPVSDRRLPAPLELTRPRVREKSLKNFRKSPRRVTFESEQRVAETTIRARGGIRFFWSTFHGLA
jgi:hypothetical protein